MKKKFCATILTLCMIIPMTACGAASDPAEDAAGTNSVPSGEAESGAEMLANTSGTVTLELVEIDSESKTP